MSTPTAKGQTPLQTDRVQQEQRQLPKGLRAQDCVAHEFSLNNYVCVHAHVCMCALVSVIVCVCVCVHVSVSVCVLGKV